MKYSNVVVAGGGVLGSQIAFQAAYCGFNVTIWLRSEGSIGRKENVYRRSVYQNPVKFLPGMDRRRDAGLDTGSAGGLFYIGRRQHEQRIIAV